MVLMLAVFQLYGLDHILTLSSIVAVAVLLIHTFRKRPITSGAQVAVSFLAFLCFISYPLNQAAVSMLGGSHELSSMLPLHLCDIAAFLCGFALITRKPLLCELSYFWGLAGTLQGLITPDMGHEFPAPAYISFFLQHGVIVITAVVLPMGLGWKPRPHAALRTYAWLWVYAVAIFGINCVLKTNFGFVMEKPDGASLLDVLGAWPWYILWTLVIAAGIFWLLELPFKRLSRK
jgi:hypothetical integral membrane protein (TIGR02206 family)